ncbi:hypothetical protein MD484_g287, partial [Candolleomyces efflorescens]
MASQIDYEYVGQVNSRAIFANITIGLVVAGYDFSYKFAPSTLTWERYLSNAATAAVILIGDVLLVYRCFVIYREAWWVAIPPSLTTIAALGAFQS